MRADYAKLGQMDFRGGINQDLRNVQPNQCSDASNVWSPSGHVEQRPGVLGVSTFVSSGTLVTTGALLYYRTGAGTFTAFSAGVLTLPTTATADIVYIQATTTAVCGYAAATDDGGSGHTPQTSATLYKLEYWNGASWAYLPSVIMTGYTTNSAPEPFIRQSGARTEIPFYSRSDSTFNPGYVEIDTHIQWVPPGDWATTTVNAVTAYWLRMTFVAGGALLAGAQLDSSGSGTYSSPITTSTKLAILQFPTNKRYVVGGSAAEDFRQGNAYAVGSGVTLLNNQAPLVSAAILHEFGEAYVTVADYGGVYVYHAQNQPSTTATALSLSTPFTGVCGTDGSTAAIEDRPEFVGQIGDVLSPYNPAYVDQLGAFPVGQYIAWFQNQLFIANLRDDNQGIVWSAPSTFALVGYRIWPSVSRSSVAGDDNTPVTAMAQYGEHLLVYKPDSIWQIVNTGVNDVGLNDYEPIRIVSGYGTIANASIANTPVGQVFLAHDGVYLFDGNTAKCISTVIDDTIATISASNQGNAVGCHWRTKSCYMLAVPTNGSATNNRILVWDYKHNAWWIWDDLNVGSWAVDEDIYSDEVIYFTDYNGFLYQLGVGDTDHGAAITSSITTQRLGFDDEITKTFRQIIVQGSNDTDALTVSCIIDDEDAPSSETVTLTDPAEAELSAFTFASSLFSKRKPRERRVMIRETGKWCQLAITNSTKNQKMRVYGIRVGYVPHGVR